MEVADISHSVGNKKFTLITTEGSMLVSSVLVSTVCDEEINIGLRMNDVTCG
jgi:hypothetical protein